MKKLVALVLTLAMAICVAAPAMAASENAQISAAIAKIQETYPGAEIEVTEEGTLEVFVPYDIYAPSSTIAPFSTNRDSMYCPAGGTFNHFEPTSIWLPEMGVPQYIIFMPGDIAEAFLAMRTNPNWFQQIMDWTEALPTDEVLSLIQAYFGITVTYAALAAIIAAMVIDNIMAFDDARLKAAVEAGTDGAVSVTCTVTENIYTELYAGWGGKYVSAAPYESGWRYDFAEGEYYMW